MQELTDCVLKHKRNLHAQDKKLKVLKVKYFAFPHLSSLNVYMNYMLQENQPLSITQIG